MDDNFSSRVKDVISYSKEEALRLGHKQIGTEHLLLGMLRDGGGKAISILNSLEVNLDELRKKIEILSPPNPIINYEENLRKNLHLTRQAERALKTTFLEAKLLQGPEIQKYILEISNSLNLISRRIEFETLQERLSIKTSECENPEIWQDQSLAK